MKRWLFLILISSCSLFIGGKESPKTAKETRYSINFNLPNWIAKNDKQADFIFENSLDGRIVISNSFCDEFQERSLESYALKTFKTVTEFKLTKSNYTTYNGREAFRLEGFGKVDGVNVKLILLNTRRDNCYFDFVGINPSENKVEDNAFDEFIKAASFI